MLFAQMCLVSSHKDDVTFNFALKPMILEVGNLSRAVPLGFTFNSFAVNLHEHLGFFFLSISYDSTPMGDTI